MALPTRHEQLRIAALQSLREGDLARVDAAFAAALSTSPPACEPDLVTEEPECKTALLRAVERADCERISRYGEFAKCTKCTKCAESRESKCEVMII